LPTGTNHPQILPDSSISQNPDRAFLLNDPSEGPFEHLSNFKVAFPYYLILAETVENESASEPEEPIPVTKSPSGFKKRGKAAFRQMLKSPPKQQQSTLKPSRSNMDLRAASLERSPSERRVSSNRNTLNLSREFSKLGVDTQTFVQETSESKQQIALLQLQLEDIKREMEQAKQEAEKEKQKREALEVEVNNSLSFLRM
jgi:hypothetical protein